MNHDASLRIEAGQGFDGPTLRISAETSADVQGFLDVLRGLAAAEEGQAVELADSPLFLLSSSVQSFVLRNVGGHKPGKSIEVADGSYVWSGRSDDWETAAMLVGPLCDRPGYQYLTNNAYGGGVIVLFSRERAH